MFGHSGQFSPVRPRSASPPSFFPFCNYCLKSVRSEARIRWKRSGAPGRCVLRPRGPCGWNPPFAGDAGAGGGVGMSVSSAGKGGRTRMEKEEREAVERRESSAALLQRRQRGKGEEAVQTRPRSVSLSTCSRTRIRACVRALPGFITGRGATSAGWKASDRRLSL